MAKKLYWLVESNGDLSVTCDNLNVCQMLIENDFENEREEGIDIDDFQYTITPQMLTQEEYEALGEGQ